MQKLTFLELAHKVLDEEKVPLTAFEIWASAEKKGKCLVCTVKRWTKKGYDKFVDSQGLTPKRTLAALIYVNAKNTDSPFLKIGVRPVRFYLKSLPQNFDAEKFIEKEQIKEDKRKRSSYLEKDLHPIMAYFGRYYLSAYLKTIDHTTSNKKTFGEWLHPDMVGCYFPFEDWNKEVYKFNSVIGNIPVKLYSFEIKRELNFSNLRESFFQAVSNSSWANESYLVAAEIIKEEDFLNELKRLSLSYGIGIIELDIENPDSSKILYPANQKENLDWETINKIVELNPDFKNFIERITKDIHGKEVREEHYDQVLNIEKLIIKAI